MTQDECSRRKGLRLGIWRRLRRPMTDRDWGMVLVSILVLYGVDGVIDWALGGPFPTSSAFALVVGSLAAIGLAVKGS